MKGIGVRGTILMTGATGAIGSRVLRRLESDGTRVVALVRDPARLPGGGGNRRVIIADLRDPRALARLGVEEPCACIFHLAASLEFFGPRRRLFSVNAEGTGRLLEFAARRRVPRFVYVSSIEAAGPVSSGEVPADESASCRPVSAYGASKLEGERRVREFCGARGIAWCVVRPGNVYGSGFASFVDALARAVRGDGALLRRLSAVNDRLLHPVYIDDLVEGLRGALEPGVPAGVFNLCGPEYVSVGKLLRLVAAGLDIPFELPEARGAGNFSRAVRTFISRVRHRADLADYLCAGGNTRIHRAYRCEAARKAFGYEPSVGIERGIRSALPAVPAA